MKTILIISELAAGGVEKVNYLLAKGLKEKYILRFLTVKGIGKEWVNDLEYISLDAVSSRKAFFRILNAIREIHPDYIITSNHTDTVCSLLYSKILNRKSKSIFVAHSVYSSMFKYRKKRQLIFQHYIPKIFRIYNKCDAVVYVSKGVKEDFKQLYHVLGKREYVIYNPVFDKTIPPLSLPSRKITDIKLVTVGRLAKEKRQSLLLDVILRLKQKEINADLYIYGEGIEKEALQKQAHDLSIVEKIHFMGFTNNILEKLKQYDVFVLTSEFESFGNVIVEAMGVGIPVVVMDCPVGPREILQYGSLGKLITNGDIASFTEAIIDLKNNYPVELVTKAYNAAKKYELKAVIKQYINMIEVT